MEIKAIKTATHSNDALESFSTPALLDAQQEICLAYHHNDSLAGKESMLKLQQLLNGSKHSLYNRLKTDALISGTLNRMNEENAQKFAFDFVKATPEHRFALLEEPTLKKLGKNIIERYRPHTNMRLLEPNAPGVVRPKNPISLAAGDALGMEMFRAHASGLMDAHRFVRDPDSIKDTTRLRAALKTMVYETEFGERRNGEKKSESGAKWLEVKVRQPSVGLQMPANNGLKRSAS